MSRAWRVLRRFFLRLYFRPVWVWGPLLRLRFLYNLRPGFRVGGRRLLRAALLPMRLATPFALVTSVRHLEYLYQSHCLRPMECQKGCRVSVSRSAYSVYSCPYQTYCTSIIPVCSTHWRVLCHPLRMRRGEIS